MLIQSLMPLREINGTSVIDFIDNILQLLIMILLKFLNYLIKDISRLGRDLSKIIIVDNMPQNFRLQKENGIFIKTFYGEDTNDTALIELALILKSNYN